MCVIVALDTYGTQSTFVGHVGHVGHVFLFDSRAENVNSYTNDTVVIYSIYIFLGLEDQWHT